MPSFTCEVCHSSFEIAQSALDKYPGWQPKYCRLHSPKKPTGERRSSQAGPGGSTNRDRSLREYR